MAWTPVSPWKLIAGSAQKLAIGAASVASTAVGSETRAILVAVTSDAHIKVTQAGTAAVAGDLLVKAAWPPIVLGCSPGDIVTVIQDAAAGSLYLQELTH
jgi:hypothetical protein